jgi:hypothetical protein
MAKIIRMNELPITTRLYAKIAAVCPIVSTTVGTFGDSSTVTFQPAPGATPEQIAAAQAVINIFDWSDDVTALTNMSNQMDAAVQAINTYLAAADTATAAQVRAEVKAIDQRQKVIIQALSRLVARFT